MTKKKPPKEFNFIRFRATPYIVNELGFGEPVNEPIYVEITVTKTKFDKRMLKKAITAAAEVFLTELQKKKK